MLDIGDPAFKLFGKTIPLVSSDEVYGADESSELSEEKDDEQKGQAEQKATDEYVLREDPSSTSAIKNELNPDAKTASKKGTTSRSSEDQNASNSVDENSTAEYQKNDEESKNSQEKSMKKPDKILPCPRCNSMDTKFCYYNNYNVNQPRHFCKSCQRYWTAGGSMRNVPVGAGRRKNKTSTASNYCHLSVSEALQNELHHPQKQPDSNGTVLNFGADSPLRDSIASMMNIGEKKILNGTPNGVYVNSRNTENGNTHCSKEEGSSKSGANQIPYRQNFAGPQAFPGFQLGYGYPTVSLARQPPGFFPPMPIYPTSYWNGAAIAWVSPISLSPNNPGSNPNSPTLGKHSREDDTLNTSSDCKKSLGSSQVLVPKTLRIDDPEEAAKSSIWTTLGLKKIETTGNGGFFKALQSKSNDKKHKMESFPVLNENPAALARSLSFQETA